MRRHVIAGHAQFARPLLPGDARDAVIHLVDKALSAQFAIRDDIDAGFHLIGDGQPCRILERFGNIHWRRRIAHMLAKQMHPAGDGVAAHTHGWQNW